MDQQGTDDWQRNTLPLLLKEYKAEEIFYTDKTGLFFECLPEKNPGFQSSKVRRWEDVQRERATVLVTAGMTGEKLPLFVIGKYANPACLKGLKSFQFRMIPTPKHGCPQFYLKNG